MYFDSLHALLTMDGHGAYVWLVYLVALVIIALLVVAPIRRRKQVLQQLAAQPNHVQPVAVSPSAKEL
ncbi:MAG: heme exporter protein CcmD [Halioglobus sp.]|nr:heme exporter protein CcmD [Halioglobus sp.]